MEDDKYKTCFDTHAGNNLSTNIPFGLSNTPATFQRSIDIIMSGVQRKSCLIYLDYVLFFSPIDTQNQEDVDTILGLLRKSGVTLKLILCKFFAIEVDYLVPNILHVMIAAAVKPTKAIRETPSPDDRTKHRPFLEACNVYRLFMQTFEGIARKLNAMRKKDADPNGGTQ